MQLSLLSPSADQGKTSSHRQLLKWIGNKQRFAKQIVQYFPERFGTYFEPFLGSGAVMAQLAPLRGVGSDTFVPLVEIWQALRHSPEVIKGWYRERYDLAKRLGKREGYEAILAQYNARPNGPDLLYLCRACYGGVVRFRKRDGYMSTPVGIHAPISPASFGQRVDSWAERMAGVEIIHGDYAVIMDRAVEGDLIYCDPPYTHSQAILYGAQDFSLAALFEQAARCKERGVKVVVSIDGTKKSGDQQCALPIPTGLFEREVFIDCGRSMLKRFQMEGKTLETECVSDRLLLTY